MGTNICIGQVLESGFGEGFGGDSNSSAGLPSIRDVLGFALFCVNFLKEGPDKITTHQACSLVAMAVLDEWNLNGFDNHQLLDLQKICSKVKSLWQEVWSVAAKQSSKSGKRKGKKRSGVPKVSLESKLDKILDVALASVQ